MLLRRVDADLGQSLLSIFFMTWLTLLLVAGVSRKEMLGEIYFHPDMNIQQGSDDVGVVSLTTGIGDRQIPKPVSGDEDLPVPLVHVTIFFHVYMPTGDDEENEEGSERSDQRALKIIQQQLHHVAQALSEMPAMKSVRLYYTTVGDKEGHTKVEESCQGHANYFTCHHLQHVEEGFEESTLSAMYGFCQEHPDERVVYLHTKGSYHYSQSQDYWRQQLTKAAMSTDCIERAHAEDCDLCGLLFLPRPSLHFTGNMYNAKCSYIRKLAHPSTFGARLGSFQKRGEELIAKGILEANFLDPETACNAGTGRFAMEHWHGSHPSLQKVCDVSAHYQIEYWQGIDPKDAKPEAWHFDVFPRHPATAEWSHGNSGHMISTILNDEASRLREYFLLPGLLIKWYELYGEAPPPSSWVWSWYPDGQFWKRQVLKLGPKAVETVITTLIQQDAEGEGEEQEETGDDDEEEEATE